MWTTLALSASALMPGRHLQVMTQTRDRKVFGSAAGRDASIADAAAQRTRAALILALESDTGGAPDFLFEFDATTRAAPLIWHPDEAVEGKLDKQVLSEALRRILSGGLADRIELALLQPAGTNRCDLRNMEFDWTDPAGREQYWQISISALPAVAGDQLIIGLVRDIGMARTWCADIDHELLGRPRQADHCHAINRAISGQIRDQAYLVSSICDLLLEQAAQGAQDENCQRRQFGDDVKAAIAKIISTADLLRDLTDASFGKLKLNLQRWQVADVAAHAIPAMRRSLETVKATLSHDEPELPLTLITDLQRLSRLLQMIAASLMPAVKPGSDVRLVYGASATGGVWLSLVYEGYAMDCNMTESVPDGQRPDILHPSMTSAYRHLVLEAHRGELLLTDKGSGHHELVVTLKDAQQEQHVQMA